MHWNLRSLKTLENCWYFIDIVFLCIICIPPQGYQAMAHYQSYALVLQDF